MKDNFSFFLRLAKYISLSSMDRPRGNQYSPLSIYPPRGEASRPRSPRTFSRKALEAELKMTPLSLMVHRKFGNWRRISSPSPAGKPLSYPRPNLGKCVFSPSLREAPPRLSTGEECSCAFSDSIQTFGSSGLDFGGGGN